MVSSSGGSLLFRMMCLAMSGSYANEIFGDDYIVLSIFSFFGVVIISSIDMRFFTLKKSRLVSCCDFNFCA